MPGGIERASVNAANLFAGHNHAVSLIILDTTAESFYPIHEKVNIIHQQLSFGITKEGNIISRKIKLLSDVLKLRRILKDVNADLVISTEYPFTIAAVLCGAKKRSQLVSWEHHHYNWLQKNRFWSYLQELAYPKLSGIVCLNKDEAAHYKKFGPPVFVIPNTVDNPDNKRSSLDSKKILSIGWLIPRKGIDLMMKTAKTVLQEHPDWTWKLIGDGEMREAVLKFIADEKLENRFILQSPRENVREEYLDASLFVLTSRFEAFPMVLLEAMSAGLPCISFDCPSGPADIIQQNENGVLVQKENTDALSVAISSLINDEVKRKKMAEMAYLSSKRFSSERIYELWMDLIVRLQYDSLHSSNL